MSPNNKESHYYLKYNTTLEELLQYKEVLEIYNDLEVAKYKDTEPKN